MVKAVKPAGGAIELNWEGATVSPPRYIAYRTNQAGELTEDPPGIGDEAQIGVTDSTSLTIGAFAAPGEVLFFKVLPADGCDQTVF